MRIIAGSHRGRKIQPPKKNFPTRPTTDFVRESLFNVLTNHFDFEDISMLDLFGGFGMVGMEAISRGCQDVTYVDKHRGCTAFVKTTTQALKIDAYMKCISMDAIKYLESKPRSFDLIFADPPYIFQGYRQMVDLILESEILAKNGWLIVEHGLSTGYENDERWIETRKYGQSMLSFFK